MFEQARPGVYVTMMCFCNTLQMEINFYREQCTLDITNFKVFFLKERRQLYNHSQWHSQDFAMEGVIR